MKILLAGGGTAGHINPALAIADYVKKNEPDAKIMFVGTKRGLESRLVPGKGYDIEYIEVEGLSKKLSLKNMKSLLHMLTAKSKCKKIIKKFGADVVIGTGGYVCAPAVMAANSMNIPTLIHEQNVFPGSAIKLLSKKSSVTAISFEDSKKYLADAKNILFTGNPIREEILNADRAAARAELGAEGKKVVLIFGGSLGAAKINSVATEYINSLKPAKDILVVFATGEKNYEETVSRIKHSDNVIVKPYIHNMADMLSAADLVVCRSGAITVSEISALGKKAIFIPSPNVTNNHQEYNARALSDKGAAVCILEADFNQKSLKDAISALIDDEKSGQEMSRICRLLGNTDALSIIYKSIKELLK